MQDNEHLKISVQAGWVSFAFHEKLFDMIFISYMNYPVDEIPDGRDQVLAWFNEKISIAKRNCRSIRFGHLYGARPAM